MRLIPFLFCAAFAVAPAAAQVAPSPDRKAAEAEAVSLKSALDRGALIYAYDQAAWHATDDLRRKMPDFGAKVGGWIVDGPPDTAEIVFHDRDEADPKALYSAQFRGSKLRSSKVLGEADERSLSPERKKLIAAKRIAAKALVDSKPMGCVRQPFNTVVVPPSAANASTLVYFLTPQTQTDAIPFGGHHRVEVPAQGQPIVRRFANSCLTMSLPKGPNKPVALGITHLLDTIPTEIHVFSSQVAKLPIAVGTSDQRIWMVEGTRRIRLLKPGK